MEPVDFLYANMTLSPAPQDQGNVIPIKAYGGPNGITTCWKLSPEELDLINKTGVVWVHVCAKQFAPMSVHALVPAFNGLDFLVFGEIASWINAKDWTRFGVIHYLDLAFAYLKPDPGEDSFVWRFKNIEEPADMERWGLTKPFTIWDLNYRSGEKLQEGKYLFGEDLTVVGKLGDLERLQPLQTIHDFLTDDMLILMRKETTAKIITMN